MFTHAGNTPGENIYKHTSFKGFLLRKGGVEVYLIMHLDTDPNGHTFRFHSYEVRARDPAGNVSYWNQWADFGEGNNTGPNVIPVASCGGDDSLRPVMFVVHVHAITVPGSHATLAIQEPAKLDPHTLMSVVAAFFAHLLRTAPLANAKDQVDREAVYDGEEGGLSQKEVTPLLLNLQQAKQVRAIGQCVIPKPVAVVPLQPTVESAKRAALQGKQTADGDQFTQIQFGLRMAWKFGHMVVHKTVE